MPSSGCQTCARSEEHTSELQSHDNLVCRLLLEKKIVPGPTVLRLLGAGTVRLWFAVSALLAVVVGLNLDESFAAKGVFFLMNGRPARSPLFPYTTVFG